MYYSNKHQTEIKIDIDKHGIYTFINESGIGKTRLFKCLRSLQLSGEPISTYTYEDKLLNVPIDNALDLNKHKIIMLDRYDMYNGDGAELIIECAKTSIVLIVCNGTLNFDVADELCFIEMTANSIEVTI